MSQQFDLFSAPEPPPPQPEPDPLMELTGLLAELRAARDLPWPTASAAMQVEYRVLHLARAAGPQGPALAEAIFTETERLFAAADHPPQDPSPRPAAALAASPGTSATPGAASASRR